jgi:hypothetical protein
MLRRRRSWLAQAGLAAILLTAGTGGAVAQSIEPRAYSPAPSGANFLIVGYALAGGGPSIDSSLPLRNAKLERQGPLYAYARALDVAGKAVKLDLIVPAGSLSGSAIYKDEPVSRRVEGFADPLLRMSVILHGAAAMTAEQLRSYRQQVIVGASLQVSAPLGQYDRDKLLNLGTHRWSFRPEIGISKASGRWTLEAQAAATLFTGNHAFLGNSRRSVRPIYSAQIHAIYALRSGAWTSLDATVFAGGRTTVDDQVNRDAQRNWRLGASASIPLARRFSMKLNASKGFWARTGNNYDLLGLAFQYRWGGGL